MAKVIFGNHSSVIVPLEDRDNIRKFYCDVLGGVITKSQDERDFLRLGDNFYIFLYGEVPDESEFLRTARSVWLEIKTDNVEEMTQRILGSGLVRKLEIPDPHLYFQAPGGQCWRLVGIDEDLSFYEGAEAGPNVSKIKEALNKMNDNSFHKTINVNAPADEAMNKISEVSRWWAKNTIGDTEKLNEKFTIDFGQTFVDFQISELIPGKKIVWKVTDCNLHWINDKKEWNGTEVVFELTEKGNMTQIDFTHVGLVPEAECYENCEAGWTEHITVSLVKYINEGEGLPS